MSDTEFRDISSELESKIIRSLLSFVYDHKLDYSDRSPKSLLREAHKYNNSSDLYDDETSLALFVKNCRQMSHAKIERREWVPRHIMSLRGQAVK